MQFRKWAQESSPQGARGPGSLEGDRPLTGQTADGTQLGAAATTGSQWQQQRCQQVWGYSPFTPQGGGSSHGTLRTDMEPREEE